MADSYIEYDLGKYKNQNTLARFVNGYQPIGNYIIPGQNYFTDLKSFHGAKVAAKHFHWNTPLVMLEKNGLPVLFNSDFGAFHWLQICSYLGLISIFVARKHLRTWVPLVCTSALFLLMCVLYDYPTGDEWQNRFLVKLNPILFGGIGYLILRSKALWRSLIGLALAFAAGREIYIYKGLLPDGMAFFTHQFGDHSIAYPQMFPASGGMYLFYLPLICFTGLAAILSWFAFITPLQKRA